MANRSWLLTIPGNASDILRPLPRGIRYGVWQMEKGSKSGYIHIQAYVELTKPQRLSWLKNTLKRDDLHAEVRKGTRDQARTYCMKEDSRIEGPWEEGSWESGGQGRRTDLDEVYHMLKDRKSLLEVLDEHPGTYIRCARGIKDAKFLIDQGQSKHFRIVKTTVLFGSAGCGKTRTVYDLEGYDNVFKLDQCDGAVWFDGYAGEDILLIDDFYGWIKWGMFLNILDGYPLRLPVKGSFAWANWTKVYITSNRAPGTWYERGSPPELKRRIFKVLKFVTK